MLVHDPQGEPPVTPADPLASLLSAVLAEMPEADRYTLISFLDFWRELPGSDRALFAKTLKPELADEEVARLSGVTRRTLYRWAKYQRLKEVLAGRRVYARGQKNRDGHLEAWDSER